LDATTPISRWFSSSQLPPRARLVMKTSHGDPHKSLARLSGMNETVTANGPTFSVMHGRLLGISVGKQKLPQLEIQHLGRPPVQFNRNLPGTAFKYIETANRM